MSTGQEVKFHWTEVKLHHGLLQEPFEMHEKEGVPIAKQRLVSDSLAVRPFWVWRRNFVFHLLCQLLEKQAALRDCKFLHPESTVTSVLRLCGC